MKWFQLLLLVCFTTSACATKPRDKVFQTMLIAGVSGALFGLSRPQNKEANMFLYSSAAVATAAIAGLLIYDSEKEVKRLRSEIQLLKKQSEIFEPQLTHAGSALFKASMPEKYRKMIRPGEWRVYQVDRWDEDGENRLIHRDQVMELIPPSLNSGGGSG